MRQLAICVWMVAIFALPLQAPAAPLRVVVYHYAIDVHGFESSMDSGFTNGHGYAQTSSTTSTNGVSGTITLNVVSVAQDGGLVVDAIEKVDRADRPEQAVRCAVYADPENVICDQNLSQTGEVTGEITALLTYFGRGFYDASRLDDKKHWQTSVSLNQGTGSATSNYTITKDVGGVLTIAVNRVLHLGPRVSTTNGTLQYDPAASLPVKAHLVTDTSSSGDLGGSTIDFQLVSDSFAKH